MNYGGHCSDVSKCVDSASRHNCCRSNSAFEQFAINLELDASFNYMEKLQLVPMRVPRGAGSWWNNLLENGHLTVRLASRDDALNVKFLHGVCFWLERQA